MSSNDTLKDLINACIPQRQLLREVFGQAPPRERDELGLDGWRGFALSNALRIYTIHTRCQGPLTAEALSSSRMVPTHILKSAIRQWKFDTTVGGRATSCEGPALSDEV